MTTEPKPLSERELIFLAAEAAQRADNKIDWLIEAVHAITRHPGLDVDPPPARSGR